MLHNTVGRPVEGDDFFDRVAEIRKLWDRLETDNVLLLAPRRVGKTSVMYHLRDTAAEHGYRSMYTSVANGLTELDFVRRLLSEIERHKEGRKALRGLKKSAVGQFFRRIRRIDLFGGGVELTDHAEGQWAAIGESIIAALHGLESKWLLLIDEVPIFVLGLMKADPSGTRAKTFLNWFRDLRLAPQTSKTVRWLLAGSIGLDTVTRRMNLGDTINDLYLENDFGPFRREVALQLLEQLSASYGFPMPNEIKGEICDRIGWLIPYHLQLVFGELRTRCSGGAPSAADVTAIFDDLLSPAKRSYFDYWKQRLHVELGNPEDEQAVSVLGGVAADTNGASEQTLSAILAGHIKDPAARKARLTYLLDVLCSDGYLVKANDRYVFRSNLLRDYWRRHVG
ncbi:MAG TPA: hypothetical protein VFP80_13050 [Thermoanaerobaculia bacterium]|nr:hypothetical protein [Thermoanaerobaculia bacterium]